MPLDFTGAESKNISHKNSVIKIVFKLKFKKHFGYSKNLFFIHF